MLQFLLALLLVADVSTTRPTLTGTITNDDNKPLAGATVYINTAAMKTGTSILCPSCYVDCGKTGTSDATGKFSIPGLDRQLRFNLLIVKDGYGPQEVNHVDPAEGAVSAKLLSLPRDLDGSHTVRGRVVDAHHQPIAGAVIEPFGCKDEKQRWWGSLHDAADPLAVSNERGEFALVAHKPNIALDLQVHARAMATKNFALIPTGSEVHELMLGEGASVSGRLVDPQGKPVAGVLVGLVQADRGPENFTGAKEIGTNASGRFAFTNVGTAGEYFIYTAMSSVGERGLAAKTTSVNVYADGTECTAGDLVLRPAHSVSGKVVLGDGKPVPPGARVLLSRENAWDSLQADCDPDGKFTFHGVPDGETVTLSARAKGYHVSLKNRSFEPVNAIFLMGVVDADIPDLIVQLDLGPEERLDPTNQSNGDRWQRLKTTRLAGVDAPPAPAPHDAHP
jgi:protocatechuate 3,4-dioxygenase beta subunit